MNEKHVVIMMGKFSGRIITSWILNPDYVHFYTEKTLIELAERIYEISNEPVIVRHTVFGEDGEQVSYKKFEYPVKEVQE